MHVGCLRTQAPGVLRPHWAAFAERAGDISPADLTHAQKRIARQLHENGVTRDPVMDYGDFTMTGKLVNLSLFDAPKDCQK